MGVLFVLLRLVCLCVTLFELVCALFVMFCVRLCGLVLFYEVFRCACVHLCVRMLLKVMRLSAL